MFNVVDPSDLVTEGVPGPTKPVMKATVLAVLRPRPGERILEIGAGSGSLTLELARAVGPLGRVYAVEGDEEALRSLERNVRDFCLGDRIEIVRGWAPEALEDVDEVDAAVVSGSERLEEVLLALAERVRRAILLNAVTPETFATAVKALDGWRRSCLCMVWGEGKVLRRGTLFSGMRTSYLALFEPER
ncbi:precorrin-6Y C5,15-methyltransferase (decarboxylating) subunit CbiT [Methanopyrus kandleri]